MIAGVLGTVLWVIGGLAVYLFVVVPLIRALTPSERRRARRERYFGDDD